MNILEKFPLISVLFIVSLIIGGSLIYFRNDIRAISENDCMDRIEFMANHSYLKMQPTDWPKTCVELGFDELLRKTLEP